MLDRLEVIWHVLTSRRVIVVTKGYTYSSGSTGANIYQADGWVKIEAKL